MAWMKRIFLFGLVNVAIMVTVSIVLNLLGVGRFQTATGLNHGSLMVFCLVWGMVGSFISLAISKWMAKKTMGVQIIDPNTRGREGELVATVYRLAQNAGLKKMPEVGIYPGMEVNAFATGPTRNNSMVAVSQGLLHAMNKEEVEGVLAHEVAHIANGDMVTMTLVQGVVNAFVMYIARVAAYAVGQFLRSDDEGEGQGLSGLAYMGTVLVFELLFGILGSMVVALFSRFREYRADAGGAQLAGKGKMIAALQRLQVASGEDDRGGAQMAAFKINHKPSKFLALFSTHPPLEVRIARLRERAA